MTVNTFTDFELSKEIIGAVTSLQYITPTEVQREVIPVALTMKDIVVKSQTGSGKTAAFAIPICEMISWEENKPQALILTPTRELAAQVKEDIINVGRFKRIKAVAIFGKQPFDRQKIELKQKTHVVAGTPGRVLDHLQKGTLNVERLKFLVLDEADEMLNMGFLDQVEAIIERLPKERVSMLFSATLPEDIEKLSSRYMKNPIQIKIETNEETKNKIAHYLIEVENEGKFALLKKVTTIENPESCIIFCRTKEQVDSVFEKLNRADYSCDKIHGGMVQEDRFDVMEDFRKGQFRYLVATDVAARGIDIEDINLVINYDLPFEKESYVHRTGRTGRAGQSGKAITFATRNETKFVQDIEEFIGHPLLKMGIPSENEIVAAKPSFERTQNRLPSLKSDKGEQLNKDIMKLYFNGGKRKKIRAVDFVGTISKIPGVGANDIGIITIQDNLSYVDILNGKGQLVLEAMKNTTVKGKLLKVHKAKE